jgi:hypothetical protein
MNTESNLPTVSTWAVECDMELIATEQDEHSNRKVHTLLELIQKLWDKALSTITTAMELKIWQKQDLHGCIRWHVYDPVRNISISFVSESEMLSWLDNINSLSRWY